MFLCFKGDDSEVQSKEYRILECEAVQSGRTHI
jgi:hypothetical protein